MFTLIDMKNSFPDTRQKDDSARENLFVNRAQEYVRYLNDENLRTLPFRSTTLPHFTKLTADRQEAVLAELAFCLDVFRDLKMEGLSLKDSPKLLWRTLRKAQLTPCSDIFDKIGEDDVVCVYSPDHIQIFQNLRFLELVTLTIEELYCSQWFHYTKRPDWATKALIEKGSLVFGEKILKTFDPEVPIHEVQEIATEGEVLIRIKIKWMSPVTRDGRNAGVIVVNDCTVLQSNPS